MPSNHEVMLVNGRFLKWKEVFLTFFRIFCIQTNLNNLASIYQMLPFTISCSEFTFLLKSYCWGNYYDFLGRCWISMLFTDTKEKEIILWTIHVRVFCKLQFFRHNFLFFSVKKLWRSNQVMFRDNRYRKS